MHVRRLNVPLDIRPPAVQVVGTKIWSALSIQSGWLLGMWAAANFMWKRGLGHYQAVGG